MAPRHLADTPRRFTILHLSQTFFTLGLTFMTLALQSFLTICPRLGSRLLISTATFSPAITRTTA
jgi:hypothetical protein